MTADRRERSPRARSVAATSRHAAKHRDPELEGEGWVEYREMVLESLQWLLETTAAKGPSARQSVEAKQHDSPLAIAAQLLDMEELAREPAIVTAFHRFAKQRKWLPAA